MPDETLPDETGETAGQIRELTDEDIRPLAQRKYEERMAEVAAIGLLMAAEQAKIDAIGLLMAAEQAKIDALLAPEQQLNDWCSAKSELEAAANE